MNLVFVFLYHSLGCPKANFGLLTKNEPHLPDVNHLFAADSTSEGHQETRNEVGSLGPVEYTVGFRKPSDS